MEAPENNGLDNGRDNKGRFINGNSGKPKGSSKNKLRDEIKTFLSDNWVNFPEWFSKLKEKEKIQVMLDLMPYAVSRLQSISQTDDEGKPVENANIDFSQLSDDDLRSLIQLQQKAKISHG